MHSSNSGSTKGNDLASVKRKFVESVTDVQELPESLKELYSIENVESQNDAFVLVLHAFMLEVGFIPKDVPENEMLKLLPEKWHDGGVYRIVYYHPTCPELCCLMTCVPLNQIISVFGTVDDVSSFQISLQVKHYINCDIGFADPSKFFHSIRELSRNFKDKFAYALLAAMQDALGFGPTFGLPVVMDDIKLQILSYLPVESLLAMCCVNKEFSELCNTSSLWKNLYLKDFSVALVDSEEVKQGWKELYKKMYLKKKIQQNNMRYCIPPPPLLGCGFGFPRREWYPPTNPNHRIGPDLHIGIPAEIRSAFPQLPQRVMHQPFVPRNSSINIPGTFGFLYF